MEAIVRWLAEQAHEHPAAIGVVGGVWLLSVFVTNGLRFAYPSFAEMPRAARFVVGFCDPLALNFWNLAREFDPDLKGEHKTEGGPNEKG